MQKFFKEAVESVETLQGSKVSLTMNGMVILNVIYVICAITSLVCIYLIRKSLIVAISVNAIEPWLIWFVSIIPVCAMILWRLIWNNHIGGDGFFGIILKLMVILCWIFVVFSISLLLILDPGIDIDSFGKIKYLTGATQEMVNVVRNVFLSLFAVIITFAPLLVSQIFVKNQSK